MSEGKDLPRKFEEMKKHPIPKDGKIPIHQLFEEIRKSLHSESVRQAAREESKQLELHLDGALEQIELITKKLERSKRR
jgi:hypothetical protein